MSAPFKYIALVSAAVLPRYCDPFNSSAKDMAVQK